jgi:hypothetical protein
VRYRHPKMPRGWSARAPRRPVRRESACECDRQRHLLATSELDQCRGCEPGGFHHYPEAHVAGKAEIHIDRADPAVC